MDLFLCLSVLERDSAEFPSILDIKKRPCPGGGGHDRFYQSAPARVSGGEEAGRFLTTFCPGGGGRYGSRWFRDCREEVTGPNVVRWWRYPGGGRYRRRSNGPHAQGRLAFVVRPDAYFREEDTHPILNYLPYAASKAIALIMERERPRSARSRLESISSSLHVVV